MYAAGLTEKTKFARRLPNITIGEGILRLLLVADFVLSTWLVDNLFHSIMAFVAIWVLQLDSAQEWPPLFGDIRATRSVRGFWGGFWHQLVGPTYICLSKLVLRYLLRLRNRTHLSRALNVVIIFLFSGFVHALVTWSLAFSCGWWEDIAWFSLNAAVIVFEGLAGRMLWYENSVMIRLIMEFPWVASFMGFL
ncbi:hypothetical protein NA57DRAFT_50479 [Rhizodiscina lignyota]|uniref:Wax synthase domain-containing protein n=1 Tax=Rhizodiscina lignyota TaxID=1504668 RepID=A0A9P4M2J1_9PEZI|nr:hypothetical protein NA57DRAFT_50479 [Rhizodiscina lignyota]